MEEEDLISICKNIEERSIKVFDWTSEVYGFGKHLRVYGRYPKKWPLLVNNDHGFALSDLPQKSDLESTALVHLAHSKRRAKAWREVSKKTCFVIFSPFVFYRRNNKVAQGRDATGTLAFPAHTTPNIDDLSNVENYIKQLLDLPEIYHPISVCLHYHDVNKGLHKVFAKYSIPVYCAGHPMDLKFTERFYDILRKFKFSTSNTIMSCLLYSTEMGIPHFIYGEPPQYFNKGDTNLEKGNYNPIEDLNMGKRLMKLFQGPFTTISKEQFQLVEDELGLKDGIGRLTFMAVLYILFAFHSLSIIKSRLITLFRKNKISGLI
jgi:hypothetical protein